jgi:hypothetical protein
MIKYIIVFCFIIFTTASANAQNLAKFSDIKVGMEDEWLEHQALRIANERATDLQWLVDYKKAKIISKKWQVILDDNGYLIGRKIHMELYCEEKNGNCKMADFTFKQKYLDEGYSDRLICIKVGQLFNVDCE